MPGGYFCFDQTSCLKRAEGYPMLVSAKKWEDETTMPGIFDPVEGGFSGWTHSMVSYCSSDAFVGHVDIGEASKKGVANFKMVDDTMVTVEDDSGKEVRTKGTHFRGYDILLVMLGQLVEKGLGRGDKKDEFVVSGCSAGAIGLLNHGDSLSSYIKQMVTFHSGCEFLDKKPFLDEKGDMHFGGEDMNERAKGDFPVCIPLGWHKPKLTLIIDSAPLTTKPPTNKKGYEPLYHQAMNLVDMLYTTTGVAPMMINPYCAEAYGDKPQKCAYGTFRLPLMTTPHMVVGMLWDTFVPGEMIEDGYTFPFGRVQSKWMHSFIKVTKRFMKKASKNQNYLGVSCYDHCVIENPFFWLMAPGSAPNGGHRMTSQKLLQETRQRQLGQNHVDDCDAFNCGCFLEAPIYTSSALLQFLRDLLGFEVSGPGDEKGH